MRRNERMLGLLGYRPDWGAGDLRFKIPRKKLMAAALSPWEQIPPPSSKPSFGVAFVLAFRNFCLEYPYLMGYSFRMRTEARIIVPEQNNPILRDIASDIPVADIKSKRIQTLIKEMKALLAQEEHGVALAASQVGEALKLFIVSGKALARGARNAPDEPAEVLTEVGDPKKLQPDQVYINPELLKVSRAKKEKHEGCLSIRGKWGVVPRAEKATIRAYDEKGVRFTRGASGFLAHIFQHEMDHLKGVLYTDKTTELYDDEKSNE